MRSTLQSYFVVRELRYNMATRGGNWLAALDLYLRESSLRTPVLEVLKSDEVRLALASRATQQGAVEPTAETVPDLVAGALAERDYPTAVRLLENEGARGFPNGNDFFLLVYLYCLEGRLSDAETLVASASGSIQKDWFVDWLWQKLNTDFGFHPPG